VQPERPQDGRPDPAGRTPVDRSPTGPSAATRPNPVTRTRPLPSSGPSSGPSDGRPDGGPGSRSGQDRSAGQARMDALRRGAGRAASGARRTGGGARRVAVATSAATVTGGRLLARAGRASLGGLRKVTHAGGAGESGLARVMELHLVTTVADTLILTALASTIFFAVPTQQARGRVATSLLITMVPFVVLAPLIGPLLDRLRRGRRYALATTTVVRAFLAWVMAGAVGGADSSQAAFSLYPAAFGFLVCQKAYIVTRAAALPRVLPRGVGLVAANSRMSLAGVAAMTVAAPLGTGINAWLGPSVTLRLAFLVFAAGTVLALALSPRVDSNEGELPARIGSPARSRGGGGPRVVLALRANAATRAFTGFLTLFLAFRLRHQPLGGLKDTTAVALVIVLAAVGGGVGTALGALLRRVRPEVTVVGVVGGITLAAAWSALAYGLWPVMVIALLAGLGQSLAKLCLDTLIQRDVPEHVRTSAFARSETLLQLAWVAGGGLGLALPLSGAWGLGIASAGMAAGTVQVALGLSRLATTQPGTHPRTGAGTRP
jgi:MFS family permease